MLIEIWCDKFRQKKVEFKEGLNVILGAETGDNSIGKSTFLLIIDFVFGGNTYANNTDIRDNVGEHDVFFAFKFGEEVFKFCRNNCNNSRYVWKCDDAYNKTEKVALADFNRWLAERYKIVLPDLSFRDAVSLYLRAYGKENCDEKRPLASFSGDTGKQAVLRLVKLFNVYASIKAVEEEAKEAEEKLKAFRTAQRFELVSKITKSEYERNQKELEQIARETESLTADWRRGTLDVDVVVSEEAVRIKGLLSRARRRKTRLKGRLSALDENGEYVFSSTSDSFAELQHFFPNAKIAKLSEIEEFHRRIAEIFKSELRKERKELLEDLASYDQIIEGLEKELQDLLENPNCPATVLTRYAELSREKERKEAEIKAYVEVQNLTDEKKANEKRLKEIQGKELTKIAARINTLMTRLNDCIYDGLHNPPSLSFTENGNYTFITPDDTGTGIAYKGLIVFDLAVLQLTQLPVLAHDSVLLKQISDEALERIVELYSKSAKQKFVVLDKQTSYTPKTTRLLEESAVLKLGSGGQELFGRSWG